VVRARSITFVQYKLRVSAEFAKEAMSDQSIVGNEILNIRWANDNPNPQAQHAKEDRERINAWKVMKEKQPDYYGFCEALINEEYPDTDGQFVVPPSSAPQKEFDADSAIAAEGGKWGSDNMGEFYYFPEKLSGKPKEQPQAPVVDEQTAWQQYYSAMGYPGYYDESGQYHYYATEQAATASETKEAGVTEVDESTQQAAEQEQGTGEAQSTGSHQQEYYTQGYYYNNPAYYYPPQTQQDYDYYQQVSQAPVTVTHASQEYHGYFAGYGQEQEAGSMDLNVALQEPKEGTEQ